MDHPLIDLIDQQIAKAEAEGQFEALPGAGKPLDLSRDPADALVERAREGAAAVSPLGVLQEQIAGVKTRLADLADGPEWKAAMQELADLELKRALEIEAATRGR